MTVLLTKKFTLPQSNIDGLNVIPFRPNSELSTFEILDHSLPYIKIIEKPTPITDGKYGNLRFKIKREDLTDTKIYGGNKVRNLEFILADAFLRGRTSIATAIPVGSNFSAAFVGHAQKLRMNPILNQVLLATHPQILDHFEFCKSLKAKMTTRKGAFKFPLQGMDLMASSTKHNALLVAPGGSNVLGATGHLKAFYELVAAIKAKQTATPELIFVGAGTGGTTAGLLAGITLSGMKTKLVAVRSAEPIICNRRRLLKLANYTLKFLGSDRRVDPNILELIECPGNSRYGAPLADFDAIFEQFYADNQLELDRTYTSKVVKAMALYLNNLRDKNPSTALPEVLYWHTFSAMASKELERKQIVPQ